MCMDPEAPMSQLCSHPLLLTPYPDGSIMAQLSTLWRQTWEKGSIVAWRQTLQGPEVWGPEYPESGEAQSLGEWTYPLGLRLLATWEIGAGTGQKRGLWSREEQCARIRPGCPGIWAILESRYVSCKWQHLAFNLYFSNPKLLFSTFITYLFNLHAK